MYVWSSNGYTEPAAATLIVLSVINLLFVTEKNKINNNYYVLRKKCKEIYN